MADLSVLDGLVGHRVLTEVVTDHVSLDFDLSPDLARVHCGDGTDHFGHDDCVTQVGLHGLWLLAEASLLGGVLELLDQLRVAGAHTVTESAPGAGLEHGNDLSVVHLKELVQLDTSVNLLSERFFYARFGCLSCLGLSDFLGCCRHPML